MSLLPFQNLFELKCLLDNIEIELCCRIESGVKQLTALVTSSGDLILHYVYGELPTVIKRVPWFTDNCKQVQALCFDPTATWCLVVCLDCSLFIIPALSIVDKRQKIDCKWSINDLTHFPKHPATPDSKPLSVVWWQTLDCNQNALVGYADGAISLISLTDGRCLATCSVADSVTKLYLCQDNSLDSVSLLINGRSGQQWRLILEQHAIGYIWPPEINSHLLDNAGLSRLQSLKQLGVEKLASLKQRFTAEGKGSRRDSQTSDSTSESSQSDSIHSGPELLPHLCDTFFAPQYARNRYLFSAFYKPTSFLTIHAVDIDSAPLYVHKLTPKIDNLLLTNRLIYAVNNKLNVLSIISTQLSECHLEGDTEFNTEALLAEFKFLKDTERILGIYKLSDISSVGEVKHRIRDSKFITLPNSIDNLQLRKPKVDMCVIITNCGVYKITLRLVTEENNVELAERLSTIFGLNLQELLESCGDLLIASGLYHQGWILYKQGKVHLLKRVLKLAITGDSRALLKFVHLCLSASKVDMSTATKIHMGNLAVMAYTELILRQTGNLRNSTVKDFMNFLRYEEFFDQILAVNVACQSGHWNIVLLLTNSRGLHPEIVAALSQMIHSINLANHDFLMVLSEPSLAQSLLIYPSFSQKILQYIRTNIDTFPTDILKRFMLQLDPSQPCALPVITRLFSNNRVTSTSLDSTIENGDVDNLDNNFINAKDFIETFIIVLIQLISKTDNAFDLLNNVSVPQRNIEQPIKMKFPDMHPLSCGYEHAAVIRNGAVYTMGIANSGCLGFGPVLAQSSPPKLVHNLWELKVKVLSVSCGKKHTLALTDFGVYAWGSNAYGQLGIGPSTEDSSYPQIITGLCNVQVVDIVAGQYHSIALTASGAVYTWGWGIHGQLGHRNSNSEFTPKLLKFRDTVIQITAGHAHSLILTNDGTIYGFGSNAFGQLGSTNMESNKTTFPVQILVLPDDCSPVIKITTAYFHNVAACENGEVYTWGASPQELRLLQSKYVQKINGTDAKFVEPMKSSVRSLTGTTMDPVDQVAVGFRHTAILQGGKLLISKNFNDEMTPSKLNSQDNVGIFVQRFRHVSCGPDFTIAMDHSGKLLSWGNNAIAQMLLGKPHDEGNRQIEGKLVVLKNTRRVIKIPQNLQSGSEIFPIEIPGLPSMAITYNPSGYNCLFNKRYVPYAICSIENNCANPFSTYAFSNKTLHYVLEAYSGFYDIESVLARCLETNNFQAASKIAILNDHFSDSLGFQLAAFKNYIDDYKLDFSNEIIKQNTYIQHSNSGERVNGSFSSSSSLDSIKQWNDDVEDQGGRESPCDISEIGDVKYSISQYVQSVSMPPISSVSRLLSELPFKNMKTSDTPYIIKDSKTREIVQIASELLEYYIKQTYLSENHILMQNILLKCIEFWLSNNLPVPILENVLLKNMDKYFYPLSVLLFCKNFNNNFGEEIVDDLQHEKKYYFLKEFSTKFCLQLCSMVLENVSKS